MGIAVAAFLIYEYREPILGFFQDLRARVVDLFDGAMGQIADAINGVIGFDWSRLLTLDGLRAAWRGVSAFLGPVPGTLWDTLSPLCWLGIVKYDDLTKAWAAITGFIADKASSLWDAITAIDWHDYIPDLSWDGMLKVVDWATWISPIRWLDLIPGFKWSDVIGPLDIGKWLDFSWSDVLPHWDRGAIIPDPRKWWSTLTGEDAGTPPGQGPGPQSPVQRRASGGWYRPGRVL